MSLGLLVAAAVQGVLGIGLISLGHWAVGAADRLVPPEVDAEERDVRRRSYVLGARGCQAIGVVIVVFAIATGIAAAAGVEPTFRPQ